MDGVAERYRFGPYCLDPVRRFLTRGDQPVPLPPKALDLLLTFVQNSGTVLDKDELMKTLWPGTAVEAGNLSQTVFMLRKALGERPDEHRYVVTIPGVGYQFAAPVERDVDAPERDVVRESIGVAGDRAIRSIAVLPFIELAPGGDEYLELGLTDALITKLGSVRQVAVRPTTAVLKYRGLRLEGNNQMNAARELRVDAVVNGTIQRSDDRIRVGVHVHRVSDGATLWAGRIDEKLTDLFTVEDSVADQVTRALTLALSEEERQGLARRHTVNTQAYHAYLKGRFFWNKRTEEGLKKGIARFEQAIALDPTYAAAYVGVADCYNLLSAYGALAPGQGYPRARAAALKALEIDEGFAEAHTSLAYATLHYYGDWTSAGREFRRALELNPNYATAHQWYAGYLAALGRFSESIAEVEHALDLDPLSMAISADVGWLLFFARQHERAVDQLLRTIEMDPNFALAHWLLGLNYEQQGRFDEARAQFETASALSQEMPFALASLAHVLAQSDRRAAAAILETLIRLSERRYISAHSIATIHAGLGKHAEALDWLEKACEERSNWVTYLHVDPRFDNLRSDPRFQAIVRRVGPPTTGS
jgi:DNA-binding winged helix-turn-helix (wHTH) protein/tetratricopeptide (TPR) repeat protein